MNGEDVDATQLQDLMPDDDIEEDGHEDAKRSNKEKEKKASQLGDDLISHDMD